jgi:hypothetical protein
MTMKALTIILMGLLLTACNETMPNRSTITPGRQLVDDTSTCPEGFQEEITKDEETGEDVIECIAEPVTRPSGALMFKSDFCGCKDGKAVTYGNCGGFCSGRNTSGAELLFANFNVTADIALSGLGSVHGWCTVALPGDTTNTKCELEAKSDDGSVIMLDVTPIAGTNSITVDISAAALNKTYVLTLVEVSSQARSNSIQIVKFSSDLAIPVLGPLKNAPISQYSCIVREFQTSDQTGDVFYDFMYRMHFYFLPRIPPTPIPAGMSNLICHDIFNPLYGINDDELYPRLELTPGIFNLWDTSDPRFYDNNGNGIVDVTDIIVQKTRDFGGTIPADANFFQEFQWPGEVELNDAAGNSNNSQPIGYFMSPWIDQSSFKSYCLNSTHYNSSNPLFKALRDIIGVDTEGLYIGEKAAEVITTGDGQTIAGYKDYILLRETDLKEVWFYLNNGVPTAPTDANVANVAVYFYFPLNKLSPFVKTSTQRIFRLRGANEINGPTDASQSSGTPTSYPPHDRKIGCIPKF